MGDFNNLKIFIHGWATDHKIFSKIFENEKDLSKIIFSTKILVDDIIQDLFDKILLLKIQNKNLQIEIISWSMGTFIALDLLKKLQKEELEFFQKISKNLILNLWSLNEFYDKNYILQIKKFIIKNKKIYLKKFYEQCFDKSDLNGKYIFDNNFFDLYSEKFTNEELFDGLNYLEKSKIDINFIKNLLEYGIKIKILNSKKDLISTNFFNINQKLDQIKNIQNFFIETKLIEDKGHLFFL
jgi:hypothetical protein